MNDQANTTLQIPLEDVAMPKRVRNALRNDGITHLSQVPRDPEALRRVPGIHRVGADIILERINDYFPPDQEPNDEFMVKHLDLSGRAHAALRNAGITRLSQLKDVDLKALGNQPNIGKTTVAEIKAVVDYYFPPADVVERREASAASQRRLDRWIAANLDVIRVALDRKMKITLVVEMKEPD